MLNHTIQLLVYRWTFSHNFLVVRNGNSEMLPFNLLARFHQTNGDRKKQQQQRQIHVVRSVCLLNQIRLNEFQLPSVN